MRKMFVLLFMLMSMICMADATMYYVMWNINVENGSTCEANGDVCDKTPLSSSEIDGKWTLLRVYNLQPWENLAVPKTCSKLTYDQWNETEMNTGGFDGALEFFGVDYYALMYE